MDKCFIDNSMLSVEQALDFLLKCVKTKTKLENINIKDSLNRVLAKDIKSKINIPPYDNSAMDGYAINIDNDYKNNELLITQRITAGSVGDSLLKGSAARIFTGAFIPKGANAVVMQEECDNLRDKVRINAEVKKGQNIRRQAEDVKIADVVLKKGQIITAQDMGLIASLGISEIKVYRKISVAIFTTGNEICEPGDDIKLGQIYNSNRYVLIGLLKSMGVELIDLGLVKDDFATTKKTLIAASKKADVIISTGGVSVGEEDYVKKALAEIGELNLWKVKMKPGKPLAFGKINNTFFLGLPGNPVSAFVVFNLFVRYFLNKLSGATSELKTYKVKAGFNWHKKAFRQEYVRVRIINDEAILYKNQSSGVLTSITWADGLVCIYENTVIQKGDLVDFINFSQWRC